MRLGVRGVHEQGLPTMKRQRAEPGGSAEGDWGGGLSFGSCRGGGGNGIGWFRGGTRWEFCVRRGGDFGDGKERTAVSRQQRGGPTNPKQPW